MSFEEAAALSDLVQVDYAWCPEHGRVTPELLEFPFSITAEALLFVGGICAAKGCEEEVQLRAQACEETRTNHVILIEDEYGRRPVIDVKPIGNRWAMGIALAPELR